MLPKIPRIERRARGKITPEYEDSGLFKGGIVQVQLALVPVFGATSRGDCTARAFTAEGTDVTVIFAGRRRPHFQALYSQLRYMYAQAQQADERRGIKMRDVNSIQLPVQCEGAWRARIERDERGQETRSMQFMVARWGFQGHDGRVLNYGTAARLPAKKVETVQAAPTSENGVYAAAAVSPALRQGTAFGG